MNVEEFKEMYMQTIIGQMPLPQRVFRQFLDWLQKEIGEKIALIDNKQDITSNQLNTPRKAIVPAINDAYHEALVAGESSVKYADFRYDEAEQALYITQIDELNETHVYKVAAVEQSEEAQ